MSEPTQPPTPDDETTARHTTALQTWREAHTEAVLSENWLLAAGLEAAWVQAVNEVPDDGSRTPDELAEARAVRALHR
jgi:hypothetical protein